MEIMREKETELVNPKVRDLMAAASEQDWGKVDDEIIPEIQQDPNGDVIAADLLSFEANSNPDIRDAVATGLRAARMNIKDEDMLTRAVESMIFMSSDEEVYPAGRAALFLLDMRDDLRFRRDIDPSLGRFVDLARKEGWVEDLVENIPGLASLFE